MMTKLPICLLFLSLFLGGCEKAKPDATPPTVTTPSNDLKLTANTTGAFVFSPKGFVNKISLTIYYHIPKGDIKKMPILMSFHGVSRNAEDYRNCWIDTADAKGFMVFAPEFTVDYFPTSDQYSLGNIFVDGDRPSPETLNPKSEWAFTIIEQLFEFVKNNFAGEQTEYSGWGHSAGAQFLHRFVLFMPESKLSVAVCSNAGWYTVPEKGVKFPYGLDLSLIDENVTLQKAFAKKLYVHLAENDTDPNASSLRHNTTVDTQQGSNRRARGRYFYTTAQSVAKSKNLPFNWIKTPEVPNVAHEYVPMAKDAAQYLFKKE